MIFFKEQKLLSKIVLINNLSNDCQPIEWEKSYTHTKFREYCFHLHMYVESHNITLIHGAVKYLQNNKYLLKNIIYNGCVPKNISIIEYKWDLVPYWQKGLPLTHELLLEHTCNTQFINAHDKIILRYGYYENSFYLENSTGIKYFQKKIFQHMRLLFTLHNQNLEWMFLDNKCFCKTVYKDLDLITKYMNYSIEQLNISGIHTVVFNAHSTITIIKKIQYIIQTAHTNTKIMHESTNIVDDPFVGINGFYYDSKGTRAQSTHIVKNGIYICTITDFEKSQILDIANTGNGFRSTWGVHIQPTNWIVKGENSITVIQNMTNYIHVIAIYNEGIDIWAVGYFIRNNLPEENLFKIKLPHMSIWLTKIEFSKDTCKIYSSIESGICVVQNLYVHEI